MLLFVCLFLQLLERNDPVRKLDRKVKDLCCGLEGVKALLEQRSSTLSDAQNVLKVGLWCDSADLFLQLGIINTVR